MSAGPQGPAGRLIEEAARMFQPSAYPIRSDWRPWVYNTPAQTLAALGAQAKDVKTPLDGQSFFICTHLEGLSTAGTWSTRVLRNGNGFSNAEVASPLMWGTNLLPYELPAPWIFSPGAVLSVDITNQFAGANIVRLAFHGIQVVTMDPAVIREALGYKPDQRDWIEGYTYTAIQAFAPFGADPIQYTITGGYDFLITQLMAASTGTFDSRIVQSGQYGSWDDAFVPNGNRYGNAQYPGRVQPRFATASSTLTVNVKETSGFANNVEVAFGGVRFPK